MGITVKGARRFAATAVGALVVIGFAAASAPSQSTDDFELVLATAGPGTLTASPAGGGEQSSCKVEGQQPQDAGPDCDLFYAPMTRVTLKAIPDDGRSFAGWSDFGCRQSSRTCTITLRDTPRYVTARFSPVTIAILTSGAFGRITLTPSPRKSCSINNGDSCEYARGTTVKLTRQHGASGRFWIGPCIGNDEGRLAGSACRVRLTSDEVIGAGYTDIQQIPPPLGSGITVVVAGGGKVTGSVIHGSRTLSCPPRCSISGLTHYDYVRLTARRRGFYRWSSGSRYSRIQIVPMSSVNRIQAVFR